jgi:ribosome-interacting GTPase 1
MEAEKLFKEAKTPEEKIAALEEMLAVIPKHKGTDKLQADIKRRISRLKEESEKKKGGAKQKSMFAIDKEGAGQIAVIGPPNTGKSSLISLLTHASPEVAEFPNTTHKPTPGMAAYEDIQFQLVDTPPITGEYVDPLMMDFIRRVDIVIIMVDLSQDPLQQFEDTLAVLAVHRIFSEGYPVTGEGKRPCFKKMLVLVNKVDGKKEEEDFKVFVELEHIQMPCLGISLKTGKNVRAFFDKLYEIAAIIRVYTKSPGKEPNLDSPFVVPRQSTLEELAEKIHKDFVEKLKFARVWGKSVREGQMVQRDYVLHDGDIVEIHI